MGEIIDSKILLDNKVKFKILFDSEEILNLKGHLKKIHVFTSNLCKSETLVNQRGNNGVTKYFRIPLEVRSKKKQTGTLAYQKLDTPTKILYLYIIHKDEE